MPVAGAGLRFLTGWIWWPSSSVWPCCPLVWHLEGGLGLGSALCSPPELHPPLWCCAGGARGGLTVSSVRAPSSRAKFLTFGPLGGGCGGEEEGCVVFEPRFASSTPSS